jgi:polyphosphate glucokinase
MRALSKLVATLPPSTAFQSAFPVWSTQDTSLRHYTSAPSDGADTPGIRDIAAFKRPARMLNDAEVQGFGVMRGSGLEVVLTSAQAWAMRFLAMAGSHPISS